MLMTRSFRLAFLLLHAACLGNPGSTDVATVLPTVDQAQPVFGVPDHGENPAIVALALAGLAGQWLCSGSLVAPDVVLTARHCLSALRDPIECPEEGPLAPVLVQPSSIQVLTGDELSTAIEVARGRRLVVPAEDRLCGADVALVLLDAPIEGVQPLQVRPTGAAQGDRLVSVGFGRAPATGASVVKLVRDHVLVSSTTSTELLVAEAPCQNGACGNPVLDETSGEILGVASRAVSTSTSGEDAYTRADVFLDWIEQTLSLSSATAGTGLAKGEKGSPDMGGNCLRGSDCSAGACVTCDGRRYCTRSCSPHDICPTHFRCENSAQGEAVCIEE
jgi:hypothetical protein